jgi:hypothetical protein
VVTSAGRTPGGGELDAAGGSRGGRASGREGRQRPNLLGAAARRLGGDGGMGKTCETAGAGMRRKISSARPCSAKVIAKCTRISH